MGAIDKQIKPPTTDSEASPGSTYFLAKRLGEIEDEGPGEGETEPFPDDVARVPVPNHVLDNLGDLSGCAVRLAVCLMREAYTRAGGRWRCSPRFLSRRQIGSLEMSAQSVRNAADELKKRGWIERRTRGQSHVYRWRLSAPRSQFTFLPLALLHEHEKLSPSGLTLLLALYRATWGWTEKQDGETLHTAWALLSMSDLKSMTGLCGATLRSAWKVIHNSAAERVQSRPGGAYLWRPDPTFFSGPRTKSKGGTSRDKGSLSNKRARARTRAEAGSVVDNCAGKGEDEGSSGRPSRLSERQRRDVQRLASDPIGLPRGVAADLVRKVSSEVIASTVGAFKQRRGDISNPGGWVRQALSQKWFTREVGSYSDASDRPQKNSEGGRVPARAVVGMTYDEMTSAVHEVDSLTSEDFFPVEHDGRENPHWVPRLKKARWAWGHAGEMLPSANKWLNRMVEARKEYEQSNR